MKLHLQNPIAKGTPFRSFLSVLCLGLFFIPAASLLGQFVYVETFQDTSAEQWILGTEQGGFTPELTANSGTDPDGDGWLRLTTAGGNQSNFAYLNSPIPSAGNTIDVEFEYTVHGGSGADGITFFMFDAATTFNTGAFGGSLGYANRDDSTPLSAGDGMAGGFFGLGFDTWGNYSNPNEGRNGGPGFLPDQVAVRGEGNGQTGYAFIEGTGDGTNPSLGQNLQFGARPVTGGATEDNYFGVKINLSDTSLLTVSMEFVPGNGFNTLFSAQLTGTRPAELMLGYAASTGGATNFHEVRALTVTTTVQPVGAQFWDSDVNNNWPDTSGGSSNWVSDGQPADWADIFFGDDYGTGAETVDTVGDRKVRSLNFDNPSNYTIQGGNKFELDAPNGGTATINVSGANYTGAADNSITHTIEEELNLLDDLTITNITDSANLVLNGKFSTNDNTITANVTGVGLVTINGAIDGNTNTTLDKTGAGTLVLTAANTYQGQTTISGGTVQISADNNLGTNPGSFTAGQLTMDGGTLNTTATFTMGNNRGITLNAGGGTIETNSGTTLTVNSDIDGTGGLTKTGAGTLILSDNDTDFSGTFNINAGTVSIVENSKVVFGRFDANDNYGGVGAINIASGATLSVDTTAANTRDIIFGGDLTSTGGIITLDAGDDIRFEDGITQIDGGTVNMTANDDILLRTASSGGTVNVTAGTVNITTGSVAGNRFQVNSGNTWNQTGGTTNVNGSETRFFGDVTVDNSQMNINSILGARFAGNITVSDGGVIDVANSLNVTGGTLSGGAAANKGTVIVGGDLTVNSAATISNRPNITMDTDGTSSIIQTGGGSSITGIGTLDINSPAGTGTTTIATSVGNLEATKIDVSGGTLLLGANNQIADTTKMELSGGYFSTGGFDDTLDTLTLTADSAIDLNGGNSVLNFADSSAEAWTANTSLTITNWDGFFNSGGGNDQIIFGSDTNGLASQVDQIYFLNPGGIQGYFSAQILASGEIVPVMVPEPSTLFGGFMILGIGGIHIWQRRKRNQSENSLS